MVKHLQRMPLGFMNLNKSQFGKNDVEIIEKSTVFDGFFRMLRFKVRHKLFAGGWSEPISRELFHRGEAAAALLYDPKADRIGLVEQFRIGAIESNYGPWCLEVVAGMFEEGESPEALIRREIEEEAGIKDTDLRPISIYYSTPGGCSERIHLYCALCDLSSAGGVHGLDHEHEDIRLATYCPDSVFEQMYASRVNNAATLIALQWLVMNRTQLRSEYAEC